MVSEAGEPLRSLNRLRLAVYAFAVGFVTGEEGGDRNYSSDCLAGWRKWKVLERPQQRPYEDARRGNYSSGFVAKEVATARHPFGRGKQKRRPAASERTRFHTFRRSFFGSGCTKKGRDVNRARGLWK
jgi:hypothetical protein